MLFKADANDRTASTFLQHQVTGHTGDSGQKHSNSVNEWAAKLMMTITRAAVTAFLPLCLVAAGCSSLGNATPTPVPPTTISSTETDLQRQMRLDYEAAEKAYRTSAVEADQLVASGATKPSAAFTAVATGKYVDLIMELAGQVHEAGYTKVIGDTVIRGVVPAGYQEKKIKLIACEDVSGIKVYKDSNRVKTNGSPYYVQHYTVTKTDAKTWKVSDVDTTQLKSLEGQPCLIAS